MTRDELVTIILEHREGHCIPACLADAILTRLDARQHALQNRLEEATSQARALAALNTERAIELTALRADLRACVKALEAAGDLDALKVKVYIEKERGHLCPDLKPKRYRLCDEYAAAIRAQETR